MIPKSLQDQRKAIIGLLFWVVVILVIGLIQALSQSDLTSAATFAGAIVAIMPVMLAYETIFQSRIDKLPTIDLYIDSQSRFGTYQLGIRNTGGSTAYNVRIRWLTLDPVTNKSINELKNIHKKTVAFSKESHNNMLRSLSKGESYLLNIGPTNEFLDQNKTDAIFWAEVEFDDKITSGNTLKLTLPISFEEDRDSTLLYTSELPETLRKLQLLPQDLRGIYREMKSISKSLKGYTTHPAPPSDDAG